MAKALMVGANRLVNTFNNLEEQNLFGWANDTLTELNTQASATEAATFSNLRVRITAGGSGTNNFQFRKAGANGNQLATRAGAGDAEDTTNTDVLAAADLFNTTYTDDGTASTVSWLAGNVLFSSGHGNFHGVSSFVGGVCDVPSATRFFNLAGNLGNDGQATEANVAFKVRGYTSFEALQVRVLANARTNDSVFRNRINGANGSAVITFATLVTGLMTATGLGDAISDGNTVAASLALLTGVEDLTVAFIVGTFKSTDTESEIWPGDQLGLARPASATAHYNAIGGSLPPLATFTEAQARLKPGFAGIAKNLRLYLSVNTYTADATLKLFQNGAAVITTTITASGGAAWYENTADSVTFDNNDEFSYEIVGGTSGDITIHMIGVTFAPEAAAADPSVLIANALPPRRGPVPRSEFFSSPALLGAPVADPSVLIESLRPPRRSTLAPHSEYFIAREPPAVVETPAVMVEAAPPPSRPASPRSETVLASQGLLSPPAEAPSEGLLSIGQARQQGAGRPPHSEALAASQELLNPPFIFGAGLAPKRPLRLPRSEIVVSLQALLTPPETPLAWIGSGRKRARPFGAPHSETLSSPLVLQPLPPAPFVQMGDLWGRRPRRRQEVPHSETLIWTTGLCLVHADPALIFSDIDPSSAGGFTDIAPAPGSTFADINPTGGPGYVDVDPAAC